MPEANKTYIKQYWPVVYMALDEYGLDYEEMLLMALGTIAAETGNFNIAIREYVSQYNTSPNGRMMNHSFDFYDHRDDLGVKIELQIGMQTKILQHMQKMEEHYREKSIKNGE
jgi:hypothetical protein